MLEYDAGVKEFSKQDKHDFMRILWDYGNTNKSLTESQTAWQGKEGLQKC